MVWRKGTTIMESLPFAFVIMNRFREERCNSCLKKEDALKKCASCKKVWYCSAACQRSDWKVHKVECPILSRVAETPTDSIKLFLRLLIQYTIGNSKVKFPKKESPCLRTFNDLMSHTEDIKEDGTRRELFGITADFIKAYTQDLLSLPNDDVLLQIFGKMVTNTFTIVDEMLQDVGVGIYLSPSVIDHQCVPNAVASFDGPKLIIRAVSDISSSSYQDVYLSYVDPLSLIEERQSQLQQNYYFTCRCIRCTDPQLDKLMSCTDGSNKGDEIKVKVCLDSVDNMMRDGARAEDILAACKSCLDCVRLPSTNIHLMRLVGKAFDAAVDAEQWETAVTLGLRNVEPYQKLQPPYNPTHGYLLANLGKLLLLVERVKEAKIYIQKALEIFLVSVGERHFLFHQMKELMQQCQSELAIA